MYLEVGDRGTPVDAGSANRLTSAHLLNIVVSARKWIHRLPSGRELADCGRKANVVPLIGKRGGRIAILTDTIAKATSSIAAKKASKEKDLLAKLQAFDEQFNHYADERIGLDLDDGMKIHYAKCAALLAEGKKFLARKATTDPRRSSLPCHFP